MAAILKEGERGAGVLESSLSLMAFVLSGGRVLLGSDRKGCRVSMMCAAESPQSLNDASVSQTRRLVLAAPLLLFPFPRSVRSAEGGNQVWKGPQTLGYSFRWGRHRIAT